MLEYIREINQLKISKRQLSIHQGNQLNNNYTSFTTVSILLLPCLNNLLPYMSLKSFFINK